MTKLYDRQELAFFRGKRLKQARFLSGLSSTQFCKDSDVKDPRFRSWETGTILLDERKAIFCIKMLHEKGVKCSLQWLLHGRGIQPKTIHNKKLSPELNFKNLDERFLVEVETFLKNTPNSIVFKVNNQDALPLYSMNSHLGCIKISKPKELNCLSNCIVKFNDDDPITIKRVCQIDGNILMLPINMSGEYETIGADQNINLIAQIIWHRTS